MANFSLESFGDHLFRVVGGRADDVKGIGLRENRHVVQARFVMIDDVVKVGLAFAAQIRKVDV